MLKLKINILLNYNVIQISESIVSEITIVIHLYALYSTCDKHMYIRICLMSCVMLVYL